ncbi:MAG: hypothetical protein GF329_16550 [Candidatus Lokiarchaeota archaeon]|nr:hypothetical protein [Candidatus Lokiarchaeota archaeon]
MNKNIDDPKIIRDMIVCGDINIDIVTNPIERIQKEVSIVQDKFNVFPGGNAANTALELSNLGVNVHFIGALGLNDPISNWLIDILNQNNISHSISFKKTSSGITFAITYKDGKRTFIATNGANRYLELNDCNIERNLAKHLHRGGYYWSKNLIGKANDDLFKLAKGYGMTTSLGLSWDPNNWKRRLDLLNNLNFCDIILLNEKELKGLTEQKDLNDAINELKDFFKGIIVIHQGIKGSLIIEKNNKIKITPNEIEIVNPTGSGDIYDAGLLFAYIHKGWDLKRSGKFATACAEVHLQNLDLKYPSIKDVKKYLKLR